MNDPLTLLIKGFEGIRFQVYDDATGQPIVQGSTVKGNPTVGYGRCLSTKGITQAEADELLEDDITDVSHDVYFAIPCIQSLSENRQNVLLCLAFQVGTKGLLEFKDFLAACQVGNWADASAAMLDSLWAKQTPVRAQVLAQMIMDG
jgi:lysozyme